jgi:holliday junction DNA helicase RuvB
MVELKDDLREESGLASAALSEDLVTEVNLRPRRFDDFVGQPRVKENLDVYVEAAKRRGDALDHILFSGLPGLGKTTLAHIIGAEMGTRLVCSSGPVMEKPGDLAGLLTKLRDGDILFIDEIHRLSRIVEEFLYSAMEDYEIDIILDSGPAARSLKLKLKRFTLIGATTREGLLTAPFRARFGVRERLDPYPVSDLEKIVDRSANLLGVPIEEEARHRIAASARGTPRIANRFVRRLRDVAEVRGQGVITGDVAQQGLSMLGVDSNGLEELDRNILKTLANHGGGPMGLKTLAVSVGEEEQTIEEVYEPFLIQKGLILKTARGRVLAGLGYKILGLKAPGDMPVFQGHLFSGENGELGPS